MVLTVAEARVLGSLMEKEITTPEAYPLSLNALVAACNQKSSRDPVMQLSERDVHAALRSLEDQNLVATDHGSRVERYENRARTVMHLRRDETALVCLLLLRGPQTPGELRSRADRLFSFDDVPAVLSALNRLITPVPQDDGRREPQREALAAALSRQPGSREQRYTHLLCGMPDTAEPTASSSPARAHTTVQTTAQAVADLEDRVRVLEEALVRAGLLPQPDAPADTPVDAPSDTSQ